MEKARLEVLVAEDNPTNAQLIKRLLERWNLHVDVVGDGEAAVLSTSLRRYAAVLMDCDMPRLDGWAATEAIRRRESIEGSPPVHIIALTANVMSMHRERCLEVGMNDFLSKPIDVRALEQALARLPVHPPAAPPPSLRSY